MYHKIILLFLLLSSLCYKATAQSYDPFDGQAGRFHADPSRYFKSASDELLKRKRLFMKEKAFYSDSNWSAKVLATKLDRYDGLVTGLKRHEEYFRLLGYINNKDTAARSNESLINRHISTLANFTSRRLNNKTLRKITVAKYRFIIDQAREDAAHTLSAHDEALIDQLSSNSLERLTNRYDALMDDVKAADVITADGKKLNAILDRGQLLGQPDTATRKAAVIAYYQAYNDHAEMAAAILIDITAQRNNLAKLHGYSSAPQRAYSRRLQLSENSVRELLNELMKNAWVLKGYQQIQADAIHRSKGISQVHSYDLASKQSYQWQPRSFKDTRQLILKALTPLGNGYLSEFNWLLEPANGALDIADGPNRVTENTAVGFPGTPVTLYMRRYNGSLSDLLRLSHEGGHAIHQKLMDKLSTKSYASGPSFMFEAFAMLNELLVMDELETSAAGKDAKAYYTRQFLNKLAHELFTSAEEGTFEQQLYDGVAQGRIKNRYDVDSLYASIMNRYDLFFPNEPERKSEWINKRLVFDDPLYNVNYLYAMLVTCKLYQQLHEDPDKFKKDYVKLLTHGFNDKAGNLLLRTMGVKLDHQALLTSALQLVKTKTEFLRSLSQN